MRRWPPTPPEFYRLSGYGPCPDVIERFWRKVRRRATHDRLFDTPADLKRSVRNSLSYFQTVRTRIATMVAGCYVPKVNGTVAPGS